MFSAITDPEKKSTLLIALGAVAVVALAGGGYLLYRGLTADPSAQTREQKPEDLHFLCDKCGKEFDRSPEELGEAFQAAYKAGRLPPVDCPECGGKACAYSPRRCPACGKYYLTDAIRHPERPPTTDPAAETCPHCGTIPYEYYLKHAPK